MKRLRLLLLVPLLLSVQACDSGSTNADAIPVCTAAGDCEEAVALTSAAHVAGPIDYTDPPPAGGPHNACWAPFGVAASELHAENWVHNLEHGGVVFLYHCPAGCDAEIADLATIVDGRPFAIVTAYSNHPKRFAAVSWGHRLVTDDYDRAALEAFYAAHANHAPESSSANPPAACVGAPL